MNKAEPISMMDHLPSVDRGNLSICLKEGLMIQIGPDITITVTRRRGLRLCIEAPKDLRIDRLKRTTERNEPF